MTKRLLLLMLSSSFVLSSCTERVVRATNEQVIASFDEQSIKGVINDLIQVNIDSYHVYNNASEHVKDKEIKNLLSRLALNHEEHVNSLSKLVLELGGHPPSFSRDFKGFLTSGYVNIKVASGKLRTLEAMETNEIITNRYYNKALSLMTPGRIKEIILKHLQDEKDHLNTIYDMKDKFKNRRN